LGRSQGAEQLKNSQVSGEFQVRLASFQTVMVATCFFAFLSASTSAATDEDDVLDRLRTRHDKVIPGKHVDHVEYLKFLASLSGGPAGVAGYVGDLTKAIVIETGGTVAKETVIDMIKGDVESTIVGGKPVYVGIATYHHWTVEAYPKINLGKLTKGEIRVPRPNTHQFYVAIGRKKSNKPPTGSLPSRFRAVNDWAGEHGFDTGFPSFHEAERDGRRVYGAWLLREDIAEWRDIPIAELGDVDLDSPASRFRAVDTWAKDNGFKCGFPNFHRATRNKVEVIGAWLIHAEHVSWKNVPADVIGNPESFEKRIQAISDWGAKQNGYSTAFPNGQRAEKDGKTVYGAYLIKKGGARHKDIPVNDLR
jgi:hypothetical protein